MSSLNLNQYLKLEEIDINDCVIWTLSWDFCIFFRLEKIRFANQRVLALQIS